MRGLGERMRRFAEESVKDLCAAKAAPRAGYAESFAKARATELLQVRRVPLLVRELVGEEKEALGYGYLVRRDLADRVARRTSGPNRRCDSGNRWKAPVKAGME